MQETAKAAENRERNREHMDCLILAAGYATRLYPLTENFPKPLLDVGGKPILDWLLDDLEAQPGINRYIVVSNHRYAEHFRVWAKARKEAGHPEILILDDGSESNETRLGAVNDILFAVDSLGLTEDLFVMAGDNLLDFSLSSFLRYAKEKGTSCVLRYEEPDLAHLKKCGVLSLDDTDRVLFMVEKPSDPPSAWCCPPFYYLSGQDVPLVREAVSDGCGVDAPGSFIAWLAEQVPVYAMEMPGKRYDVGSLAFYERIRDQFPRAKENAARR